MTIRRTAGIIRLEATGERDESDPYRHKWVTRLRFGLLSAEGPNTRGAVDRLADELRELASCPEAITALAKVRPRAQRMTVETSGEWGPIAIAAAWAIVDARNHPDSWPLAIVDLFASCGIACEVRLSSDRRELHPVCAKPSREQEERLRSALKRSPGHTRTGELLAPILAATRGSRAISVEYTSHALCYSPLGEENIP